MAKELAESRRRREAEKREQDGSVAPHQAAESKSKQASAEPAVYEPVTFKDAIVGPYGLKLLLWALLQAIFIMVEFGVVFFIVSLFYLIYATMENNAQFRRKGELSAYSVFNKGQKRLAGTFDVEQFERELR